MNNDKQTTQGNPVAAISLEKMREAIEAIADLKSHLHPLENLYVNEQGWQRLLTEISGFYLGASMDSACYKGYLVISDPDVPHNQFIMCSADDWGYYKQLKKHTWVDISAMTDHQINYAISLLKRPALDTLSDLVYPYRDSPTHIEIEGMDFGKAIDSDTTT